jgi:multimeric flavodoxin WrbA
MADLNEIDEQLCATSRWDFSDLRALFINCTLKRSPEVSHTQALGDRSIHERVMAADILLLLSPIWLGEKSSVCTQVVERLYGNSHLLNEDGQYAYYGRVGGCIITGNEDGAKHCSMNILYSLQHLGYSIPPQADSAWLGDAGPGPSYLDEGSGGPDNDFTNRNTTFLTWNILHLARMLKDAGGIPAHGNQRTAWDAGCRFDFANPEHR